MAIVALLMVRAGKQNEKDAVSVAEYIMGWDKRTNCRWEDRRYEIMFI
jgi:hypothetical protein